MKLSRLLPVLAPVMICASGTLPAQATTQQFTLQAAIARAQAEGHQARAATSTRDAARFRHAAFQSRLLPQLSLNGTLPAYNRSIIQVLQPDGSTLFRPQDQTNASMSVTLTQRLPGSGGDLFVSSALARLSLSGQQSRETWSSTPFTVGVRQDIFRPNVAAWDQREQTIRADLGDRQFLEAREGIALTVSGLFFDVYSARMSLANAEANVAVNDTLFTLNKGRYEVGRIGENDLLQSELALLRSRTSLDGARLEFDRAVAALRLALNLPIGTPIEVVVDGTVPAVTVDTALAVREALENRAVVSEVRLQEVQARRNLNSARLNNGMGATLQASYGYNATAPRFGSVYGDLQEARQFSLAVQMPLWQWGARGEGIAAARAEQERAAALGEVTVQQTAQEAHFAALQLAQAQRALELSAKADTVAGKRFEVAYNRYVIGRIAIDNLYVAQTEKDQALAQYIQALRGYWQAYYRLRQVTLYDFSAGQRLR